MGRPPIPIESHIDKLVQAILIGATYELAAKFAGISYKTFERWRQQAARAEPGTALALLRDRLEEAEGRAAITWLAKIEQAASDGDWRAAQFKLQARYPEMYGGTLFHKVAMTDVSGQENAPLVLKVVYENAPPGVEET